MRLLLRLFLFVLAVPAIAGCGSPSAAERETSGLLLEWRVEPEEVSAEALRSAIEDQEVRRVYQARRWTAAWDKDRASELLGAFAKADRHALEHVRFLPEQVPESAAGKEAALTKAAINYAGALARGHVNPKRIWSIYTVPAPKTDVAAGLASALASDEPLGPWFDSLAPQTDEYRALSVAYLQFRDQAAGAAASAIAGGELIRPGESDPRVPRIVEALRINGYLGEIPGQEGEPQRYTRPIAEAVARLQNDYGIDADGIVGPDTLEIMNTGSADRARQLAVNLERRRWLEREPPATRIDVNTAATFLDYWRDGHHRDRRRVVDGQPDWETPQLQSPIFQLVANPSWTVPESIYEAEIAPKGSAYLRRNNMVWKNRRVVQLPGPKNSLGLVKFDMKNDHAIYLHDTPVKQLFAENERHRSHGCVRVERAVDFARMIAADDGIVFDFDEALMSGEQSYVSLKSEVPVRLLYHTAFVDGGQVRLRIDAYGWDEPVAAALGLPARGRRPLRKYTGDIGP